MKNALLKNILHSVLFVCILFCNFAYINGISFSLFRQTFAFEFSGFWFLNTLIFLLLVLYIFLTYCLKNNSIKLLFDVLILLAGSFYLKIAEAILANNSINIGPGLVILLSIFLFLTIGDLKNIFSEKDMAIKDIVEIAIFVSIAVILDMPFCKIKVVENGGSISLTMLPLVLLSIKKGFLKGFIGTGLIFGLVTCLLDGYGFISYPLDYLLGFGSLAIVGLFGKSINTDSKPKSIVYFVVSTLIAVVFRTLFSTISGIVIYKLDFTSSLIYQLTYIGPSFIAVIIAGILILPIFLHLLKKYPD